MGQVTSVVVADVDRRNAETLIGAGFASTFSEAVRIALAMAANQVRPMTPTTMGLP